MMDPATAAIQAFNAMNAKLDQIIAKLDWLRHGYLVSSALMSICVALWVAHLWLTARHHRTMRGLIKDLTEQVDNYRLRTERLEQLTGFTWDHED